jgi:hypothetical protein
MASVADSDSRPFPKTQVVSSYCKRHHCPCGSGAMFGHYKQRDFHLFRFPPRCRSALPSGIAEGSEELVVAVAVVSKHRSTGTGPDGGVYSLSSEGLGVRFRKLGPALPAQAASQRHVKALPQREKRIVPEGVHAL